MVWSPCVLCVQECTAVLSTGMVSTVEGSRALLGTVL